jgi:DNA-binding beta-propeller fold protein YncE
MAADGRIWVASSVDGAFRILTADGKLAETWGPPPGDPHAFKFTFASADDSGGAIAFAPDGGFWVLDSGNFRIERFDKSRSFLGSWGRFGSAAGEFAHPTDISVDRVGAIFVADDGRKDIQVFSSDGVYQRSVAVGVAGSFLSANGDGYVDTSLLPDGRPGLTEYKPDGSVQGGLDMPDLMPTPLGMARDRQANLYVVGLNRSDGPSTMVRFNQSGDPQNVWDAGGLAVVVSPAGDAAYVLQATDETIKKYVIPAP